MKYNNIAMIIPSCDAFADIIDYFFTFQERYMGWWDKKRYLIREELPYNREGVITLTPGKEHQWTLRMQEALKFVDEKYVLFLLDDYFIGDPISEANIENAIDIMEKENLKYYKLCQRPHTDGQYKNYEYLASIPKSMRYGINLAECIFRMDFLKELIGTEERNIWRVETDLLQYINDDDSGVIEGCVVDKRNILRTYNGVLKGKWIPATVKHFAKCGYKIDMSKRGCLKKSEVFKQHAYGFCDKHMKRTKIVKLKKIMRRFGFKFVSEN